MISLSPEQLNEILPKLKQYQESSKLGFFSKPFLIDTGDKKLIIKTYFPVKNSSLTQKILELHEDYVIELQKLGILVPETWIHVHKSRKRHQIIIAQEAFDEAELVRPIMEKADTSEFIDVLGLLLADTLKYWKAKGDNEKIGFHPTLRNYALQDGKLHYFDTFPPMLLKQQELNRLIITMAPFKLLLKPIIPSFLLNIVSDEYYEIEKMLTGIIGSCCRLRPEIVPEILKFSVSYIKNSNSLQELQKKKIIEKIQEPPRLPGIWVWIRKLTGNVGKPNIKS